MTDLEIFRIWLYREGHHILSWWLLATLAGLAAWPLVFRLLRRLPDRGYTLARPAGMLASGFVLWFLGSLGLLRNGTDSAVLAWAVVLAMGIAAYVRLRARDRAPLAEIGAWLRANGRVVLAAELVFGLMFLAWAIVRAYDPNIAATEKPMEMAFLNATRRSGVFPPHDPWMAGYAISYYYFGYVMVAALANLSGVVSGAAFNLGVALFFALAGVAAYGLVFNLVQSRRKALRRTASTLLTALLGPLFIVVMGNLGGLVHLTWTQRTLPENFYVWLDVKRYNAGLPDDVVPHAQWNAYAGGWWWWQSSRVIRDLDLQGETLSEIIDEFPFFSFLLGDLHPHVLALPFSLLALGLALNLVLGRRGLDRYQIVFYALCLGGLIFLNLLDGPLYMAFVVGAELLRRLVVHKGRLAWFDWVYTVLLGAVTGALSLVLYLPFFVGFRSQAGGLLPNVIAPTRFRQFFVMFGPFLVMIAFYLAVEWWRGRGHMNWNLAISLSIAVVVGLVVAVAMLGLQATLSPEVRDFVGGMVVEVGGELSAFAIILGRRVGFALTSVVLAGFIAVVIARLFGRRSESGAAGFAPQDTGWTVSALLVGAVSAVGLMLLFAYIGAGVLALLMAIMTSLIAGVLAYALVRWALAGRLKPAGRPSVTYSPEAGFVLLMIGAGAALTLLPDYVYVADNFRSRMNTIFKFYYQAWAMWGIASAYAVYGVLGEWAQETGGRLAARFVRARWVVRLLGIGGVLVLLAAVELAQAMLVALALAALYAVGENIAAFFVGDRSRALTAQCAFRALAVILVVAGLVYPIAAVAIETRYFTPTYTLEPDETGAEVLHLQRPKLDGTATMFGLPDDEAAIRCLSAYEQGDDAVLAEAVGGQYSQYARAATLSGISNVIGWGGHESQWRGPTYPAIAAGREPDIRKLYEAPNLEAVQPVIERYGIDYIFVGALERRDFPAEGLRKFERLDSICEYGDSVVYVTHQE